MEIATLRTDYGDLDVLTDIPGPGGQRVAYDDLVEDATEVLLAPGLLIRIASVEAIVASKEWADRPKDREALPELREIAERARRPPQQPGPADGLGL
jgi:hypothetical protein